MYLEVPEMVDNFASLTLTCSISSRRTIHLVLLPPFIRTASGLRMSRRLLRKCNEVLGVRIEDEVERY